MKTLHAIRLAATFAAVAVAPAVLAQAYPAKPIRLILPFPPAGPTDIAGRVIAQKLSEQVGQPVVPGKPARCDLQHRAGDRGKIPPGRLHAGLHSALDLAQPVHVQEAQL